MLKPVLQIIICSTRPGRVGKSVGEWFAGVAREHGGLEVQVADLAEINLPFMNEPNHPRMQKYTHQHTKDWSERIAGSDAIVFVTPEYNYGFNAQFKNALDYLYLEWGNKPVGFVSYGGISGGMRAVQMMKQVVTTVQMFPMNAAVAIPNVAGMVSDDKQTFSPSEPVTKSATALLDELVKTAPIMAQLRT
ncbi:NADPH-dependent FMN reductase [Blastococcus sp. Marseille-P5729]|uniref:NADPH-dependent FMN reductase n=1 Tax=Blastococcus sp. Marseille-P5729 TaxID=2086582 RepID=UPI000D0E5A7C|nr:NAD(P)H-dependent oxidoreductase [Blastococcus sp. Marseille-P5729]